MAEIIGEYINEVQKENYDYLINLLKEEEIDLDNLNKYLTELFDKNSRFRYYLYNKFDDTTYNFLINRITSILGMYSLRYDQKFIEEMGGFNKRINNLLNLLENKN